MFEWEGRISDNKSIQVVKAALPYLDIPVGSIIDIEGLLRAIRNFCHQREQKMIDMFLNFFMMKRVMSISFQGKYDKQQFIASFSLYFFIITETKAVWI